MKVEVMVRLGAMVWPRVRIGVRVGVGIWIGVVFRVGFNFRVGVGKRVWVGGGFGVWLKLVLGLVLGWCSVYYIYILYILIFCILPQPPLMQSDKHTINKGLSKVKMHSSIPQSYRGASDYHQMPNSSKLLSMLQ